MNMCGTCQYYSKVNSCLCKESNSYNRIKSFDGFTCTHYMDAFDKSERLKKEFFTDFSEKYED
jgi:hypothetical protein